MKALKLLTHISAVGAFALAASVAVAEPVKLTKDQMDQVVAGAITATKTNGGGNTPNGSANGVPTVNTNPSGSAPPGQNK